MIKIKKEMIIEVKKGKLLKLSKLESDSIDHSITLDEIEDCKHLINTFDNNGKIINIQNAYDVYHSTTSDSLYYLSKDIINNFKEND